MLENNSTKSLEEAAYTKAANSRYIIEKTGNVAAVQRQLGHKHATYSMQYSRITDEELNGVLEGR